MVVDRILREPERAQLTGVSRSAWAEAERKGLVPRRVQLIGGRVGWRLSELQAWIKSREHTGANASA